MTRIVASVVADTPAELMARAQEAANEADLVEIRLDGPSGLPWDLRPFFELRKPTIATVRHVWDGGATDADDRTRAELLRRALRAGAAWIDVELASDEAASLARDAHALGARVIMSVHDLEGTPSADALLEDLRAARRMGADIAKIATKITGPDDAVALIEAAMAARREGIPCALMAINDPFLRLLAPTLDLALAYASPEAAPRAAPGQVPVSKTRDVHEDLARASPLARATGSTRPAFVLGHPVAHSKSPAMHNAAFAAARIDACYLALDVAPEALSSVLRGLAGSSALGVNLTIPHKVSALALVDEISPSARRAGAINTIEFQEGRMIGHNTDGQGALDALAEADISLHGARALVLGAGGAARAVIAALLDAGANVQIANRTLATAQELANDLGCAALPWESLQEAIPKVDLVVNATSLGLLGGAPPIDVAALPETAAILDCVYAAKPTGIIRAAKARGLKAITGESMLLHQGARAFRIWTGTDAPLEPMRRALEEP